MRAPPLAPPPASDPAAIAAWLTGLPPGAPFSAPGEEIDVLQRFRFRRLAGSSRERGIAPSRVPPEILAGLAALRVAVALAIVSDGFALSACIGVFADDALADRLARSARAAIGGGAPHEADLSHAWTLPSWGCFSGVPETAARRRGPSPADMIADSLLGEPRVQVVLATPLNESEKSERLRVLRERAEALDRELLRFGTQQEIDRAAVRARALLDLEIRRLEHGVAWKVASLFGARTDAIVAHGASMLAGFLASSEARAAEPFRFRACSVRDEGHAPHAMLLTASEVASLLPLPTRDRAGFPIGDRVHFDVDHVGADSGIVLGEILDGDSGSGTQFVLPADALVRHALVAGHTGAGKSTSVRRILLGLAERKIPFLVIEPTKGEYRTLASKVEDLCVLRVGVVPADDAIPFQINPLSFPEGFPLHTHVDLLKQAFVASFGLVPPGPYLLETAIHRAYESRGWDLPTGTHPGGHAPFFFPTLRDLLAEIDAVVAAAGYSQEVTRNVRGALRTRIGNLCSGPKGMALDTREELPSAFLFDGPLVLELGSLGADEEKAFVMGLIVMRLYQLRETRGATTGGRLQHLLVIEEAHRLLKDVRERASEEGNMAHQAVAAFANVLAEVRAFGQGILAVEQIPSKLAPEVVKHAGLKLVHRLPPRDDRDAVGDSMALDDDRKRALALLPVGHGVAHFEGMDGAVRLRVAATAEPPCDASLLEARIRSRLGPRASSRLLRRARRARLGRWLAIPDVRRAFDRGFIEILSHRTIAGSKAMEVLERDVGNLIRPDGATADVVRRVVHAGMEQGLEQRLALHRGGPASLERLTALLDGAIESRDGSDWDRFGSALHEELSVRIGPYPFCDGCPSPCLFRGDAAQVAAIASFRESLLRAREGADAGEVAERLARLTTSWVRASLGSSTQPPPALVQCTMGQELRSHEVDAATIRILVDDVRDAMSRWRNA